MSSNHHINATVHIYLTNAVKYLCELIHFVYTKQICLCHLPACCVCKWSRGGRAVQTSDTHATQYSNTPTQSPKPAI